MKEANRRHLSPSGPLNDSVDVLTWHGGAQLAADTSVLEP